jgi:hypothetical protein
MEDKRSKDSQKEKRGKKPYARPEITSEPVFATVATGCSKVMIPVPPCTFGQPGS